MTVKIPPMKHLLMGRYYNKTKAERVAEATLRIMTVTCAVVVMFLIGCGLLITAF